MKRKKSTTLPLETKIEVIAIKEQRVSKKEMTYDQALKLTKRNGWNYYFYQLGFSQFKLTIF